MEAIRTLLWCKPTRARTYHHADRRSDTQAHCGAAIDRGALWVAPPAESSRCSKCMAHLRNEMLSIGVDMVLAMMESPLDRQTVGSWGKIGRRSFDGAVPMLENVISAAGDFGGGLIYKGWHPSEVVRPFDARVFTVDQRDRSEVVLARARSLDTREIRGRVRPSLPYPVLMSGWWMKSEHSEALAYGYVGDGLWKCIDTVRFPPPGRDDSDQIQLIMGLSMWLRTRWRVYLSEGALGITIPTDATGVRELFRLRDIPEGKQRRAALRHWVIEHWRINSQDDTDEVLVREHLRGATDFHWSGLRCKITPSDLDLKREYDARIARAQARIDGTDHRPSEAMTEVS